MVRHLPGRSAGAQPTWWGTGPEARPTRQTRRGALSDDRRPGSLALQHGSSPVAPRPHTISLAQKGFLVQRRTPAPGGGCVASPLDFESRTSSLTAKPRPEPDEGPRPVNQARPVACGSLRNDDHQGRISLPCGWAPQSARGPPGAPPFSITEALLCRTAYPLLPFSKTPSFLGYCPLPVFRPHPLNLTNSYNAEGDSSLFYGF